VCESSGAWGWVIMAQQGVPEPRAEKMPKPKGSVEERRRIQRARMLNDGRPTRPNQRAKAQAQYRKGPLQSRGRPRATSRNLPPRGAPRKKPAGRSAQVEPGVARHAMCTTTRARISLPGQLRVSRRPSGVGYRRMSVWRTCAARKGRDTRRATRGRAQ
jgi:hypothetical protein